MSWEDFAGAMLHWSSLFWIAGVLNWIFGGAFPLGRPLVLRRSWLFVTMRCGGLALWLWTFPVIDILDSQQTLPEMLNLTGAVVMLVGTARKRAERKLETPSSVKSLFGDG